MGTTTATDFEAPIVVAQDLDGSRRIAKDESSIMLLEEVSVEGEDVVIVTKVKHHVIAVLW